MIFNFYFSSSNWFSLIDPMFTIYWIIKLMSRCVFTRQNYDNHHLIVIIIIVLLVREILFRKASKYSEVKATFKDHVYRMAIVEGRCTMARSSSFRSKLFIGWHKSIVSSDWSDTMVWIGQILLLLYFSNPIHMIIDWYRDLVCKAFSLERFFFHTWSRAAPKTMAINKNATRRT